MGWDNGPTETVGVRWLRLWILKWNKDIEQVN